MWQTSGRSARFAQQIVSSHTNQDRSHLVRDFSGQFAHPTGALAFALVMCVDGIRTSHKLVGLSFPSADSTDRVRQ